MLTLGRNMYVCMIYDMYDTCNKQQFIWQAANATVSMSRAPGRKVLSVITYMHDMLISSSSLAPTYQPKNHPMSYQP